MPAYQYQAINRDGLFKKGAIEADSEKHARQSLRDLGLTPTDIRPIASSHHRKTKRHKLSPADLALLTRQLATLLAAGIPVEEALLGVSEQSETLQIRELMMAVRSKVLEGYGLAQSLSEFPGAFPELYQATVGAGEQTGRLDLVLEKLADYTEKQQTTRQKINQALIYPILMIIVSTAIIIGLLTFVVPKIIAVFNQSGQTLPLMTTVLINMSEGIKNHGFLILVTFILLVFVFKYALLKPNLRRKYHQLLLKLPLISYMVRTTNTARYIHTFGILFAAGVNVLETMRVSAGLITNDVMRESLNQAQEQVREGSGIYQSLKETGFLSPMTIHLIASGEKSGQLSAMMERAASHMDTEIARLIDTALTLLEPLIILFMGAVVLFIVLATLLPIFSMEQLVS
jgi:general secretion pathway protein F